MAITSQERLRVQRRERINLEDVPVKDLIEELQGILDKNPTAVLHVTSNWDADTYIKWWEPETDEEYKKRIDANARIEADERRLYAQLRAKYEPKPINSPYDTGGDW